jgi:dihydroorotate dehydrogenase
MLFALGAERAHGLTIAGLKTGLVPGPGPVTSARLKQTLWGLEFPNPVGLAAGFDKNAEVPDAMLKLGFGFVECGTVTPLAQAGNPRPRVFRLAEDRGVINRLGFNNEGHEAAARRLAARGQRPGIVGINLGANKDASDRIADYAAGYRRLAALAAYVTVNISSPNTPGLRGLQNQSELEDLLGAVTRARSDTGVARPILLKIAPDLDEDAIAAICATAVSAGIEGLIVSNTTIARPGGLRSPHARETGGLSGAPLKDKARAALQAAAAALQGRLKLVAAGGIDSAGEAYARIRAGASLVQLYSAMVYEGPGLAARIARDLDALLARDGLAHVSQAVGAAIRPSGAGSAMA